jgi:tetratricopeptide (TPR) repeat protein
MSAERPIGRGTLPLTLARQVDEVCLRFEAAWQAGERPRIEDYLAGVEASERPVFLRELLLLDLEYRNNAGEQPPATEYHARFGEDAAVIDAVFRRRDGSALPPTTLPGTSSGSGPERTGSAADWPCIPGYGILGELGRGGMGVVYRARHVPLKRLVALKMILGGPHADPAYLARFRTEAEAAARLHHPNIVQIYETGEHGGLPFLALEFVDGGSLQAKLAGNPQQPTQAASLAELLARAIHVAHQAKVVHRDLKPANVLLTGSGVPKVGDFGLAKQLDAPSGQTLPDAILGTPSYMAPEQAAGRGEAIGPATDVYALGAILYECLTGRPPFKGQSVLDTLDLVRTQEPVPPRQLQPKLPHDLETVCLKCLQKEPARRYGSALELAEDLRRFLDGQPIRARPVSAAERVAKWARRRPSQAGLVVASALAVLGLVVGSIFYGLYKGQKAALAEQQAAALHEQLRRHQQIDDLRQRAEEAEAAGNLDLAREHLTGALAILGDDPNVDAADRRRLEESWRRIDERLQREADRGRLQKKIEDFEKQRGDILFQEINFSERDREANREAIRRAAPAALQLLGLTAREQPTGAERRLQDQRDFFASPEQMDQVAAECYQVLLAWAEAQAGAAAVPGDKPPARQALDLLGWAEALRQAHSLPTPHAYHTRRARYLDLVGDKAGARAAREEAGKGAPETALDLFLTALDGYREKQLAQATAGCDKVLRLEPDHFWARYLQALCYLQARRGGEARVGLTACLGERPAFFWARMQRAMASMQLKDLDAAEDDFAQALRESPDDTARAVVLTSRGAMWVQRYRWAEAERDLTKAKGLRPDAPEVYVNLTSAYAGRQQWDATFAVLGQALGSGPGNAWARANLAAPYPSRQDLDAARDVLGQALDRWPNDAALYHERARLHAQGGNLVAARSDLEQATKLEPAGTKSERLASDYVQLAHLQHQARDYRAALDSCDAALKAWPRPDYPPAYRQRAQTLLALATQPRQQPEQALGHYREAGKLLDRYLDVGGKQEPEVYRTRGLIHAELGEHLQAIESYGRALELRPDARTFSYRGWAYLMLDAPRPALADFEAALRLDSTEPDALCGRGHCRVRLGSLWGAVADADAALDRGPYKGQFLLSTACIYAQAAGRLQAEMRGRTGYGDDVDRLQGKAVALLRAALETVPDEERGAFWRQRIQNERDLAALRYCDGFRELARSYAR